MKVCFFGAYDRNFTSNKIVLKGLDMNGVEVVEVNAHIPVTRLDSKSDMTTLKLISRVFKKWQIINEVVKHWQDLKNCDYLYVGYPGHFDVLIAYPIAKLLRKKIIFNPLVVFYTGFVDDQGILSEKSFLAKILKYGEKLIYKMCDIVVADTDLQADHLHEVFDVPYTKMHTLAIGADDQIYKYVPKVKATRDFNVIYYGLYSPLHGVEYIVEAAQICQKDPSIKFLMIGNGNAYEATVKAAKQKGLTNLIFYPDMTEVDAFTTLAKGDVFLGFLQKHPSVDRIIPNKVYQGLAMGKAVITGDAPVIRSVFKHKSDIYLCKVASGRSLSDAILELKTNYSMTKSIAKNGYNLYIEKFTPKKIGAELVELMRKSS